MQRRISMKIVLNQEIKIKIIEKCKKEVMWIKTKDYGKMLQMIYWTKIATKLQMIKKIKKGIKLADRMTTPTTIAVLIIIEMDNSTSRSHHSYRHGITANKKAEDNGKLIITKITTTPKTKLSINMSMSLDIKIKLSWNNRIELLFLIKIHSSVSEQRVKF